MCENRYHRHALYGDRDWLSAKKSFVTASNRPAEKVAKDAKRLKTGGDFLLKQGS
jgi:hypothetical protein